MRPHGEFSILCEERRDKKYKRGGKYPGDVSMAGTFGRSGQNRRSGGKRTASEGGPYEERLFELEELVAVPGGHVGDDDAIAREEALSDLDTIVGDTAESDFDAAGFLAVVG